MRAELEPLLAFQGARSVPPVLDTLIKNLEQTKWPEVASSWSRLTPSGFPVELTILAGDPTIRWTAEMAPPECPEDRRLARAAAFMADFAQPPPSNLLERLRRVQAGRALRFGAWLGGREGGQEPRLKLYAELPDQADLAALLPDHPVFLRLSPMLRKRMLGIEPGQGRIEVYVSLPRLHPDDLHSILLTMKQPDAMASLDAMLPDGVARLRGRKLGLSVAVGPGSVPEVALFATARTLFPGDHHAVSRLVPPWKDLPACRLGMLTMALGQGGRGLRFAVGVAPPDPPTPGQP